MVIGKNQRHVWPRRWLAALACIGLELASGGAAQSAPARAEAPRTDTGRWATLATPVFRTYNQDDGLPNPVATAITEDGDGFIWVGTQGGLARWDGYRFRNYKPVPGDAGALPDTWVTTLHTDPRGRLWIGTSAGGLAVYDREHDRFTSYGVGPGGLSNVNVRAIADDGAGGLWVATDGGLDRLDPETGRITSLRHTPGDGGSLPDSSVFAVLRDRSGDLWAGTKGGLARRQSGSDRFVQVALGGAQSGPVAVNSLCEDSHGRIWIGTTHDGAFMITPESGTARWPAVPVSISPGGGASGEGGSALNQEWVFSIAQAGPDEIWLGTYGRGIVAVDPRTGQTRGISQDTKIRQSLPSNTIYALHRDRTGAMWVGTDTGLSRLNSSASGAVLTIFGDTSNPRGFSNPNAQSLAAVSDGHVWAGLNATGIDILDPLRGRVKRVTPDPSRPEHALPATRIMSMLEWSNGTMYVGTTHGLYRTDLDGGRVTRLTVPGRDPLADTRALITADNRLWIADHVSGVWTAVPKGDSNSGFGPQVEHFDAGQLTDARATTFARGLAGDLWIGTRNGLNRLDLATRKIERILPDRANPAALEAGDVTSLVFDRAGRLWVGTEGGGIAVLTGRAGGRTVFRRIDAAHGLPDDNVDSLLPDSTGRIWAATDNGIAVIDPTDFSLHALHRADGVEISAYWVRSEAATANGELLFGGEGGGVTVVRPDRFQIWSYRPSVVVTDAQIGGKPVPAGRFNGPGAGHAEPLLVRPDANSLAIEFAALDYSAPDRNRYEYWLEGFDRGWIATDASRRLASYTNLPPGSYTLHLRGSNRNGVWSESALDIPVRVLPAWFQTLWFKVLLGCVVFVSVWLLVQSRTSYLRRRQAELEHLVTERTSELEESKRQIEVIAYHDALTGLPNRRLFADELRGLTALVARQGNEFALLMIDLDRFKQINDTLGHDAGDALLVEAARRMRAPLRVSDRLFRLGGDEFAILLPNLPGPAAMAREAIETICGRIIACFDTPIPFQAAEMKTSASVGVAICPASGDSPETVYKAADLALYEAKRAGKNTWRWHTGAAGAADLMEAPMA